MKQKRYSNEQIFRSFRQMILRLPFCMALISGTLTFNQSESEADEFTDPATPAYERVKDWPNLPEGYALGNPTGLDIDSEGNLWVFHRGSRRFTFPMPQKRIPINTVTKIDGDSGRILNAWGKDLFIMPHGLAIDDSDNIWVTHVGLHQVFKFDSEGALLMTLGEAGVSGRDATHFKFPTDVAVASDGSFHVADGYGNSRVAKFSADGILLAEWGSRGRGRDELRTPHGIALDNDENVYLADRENNRIKKFDSKGTLTSIWENKEADQLYSISVPLDREHLFAIDYDKDEDGHILGSDILRLDLNLKLQIRFGRSGAYEGEISRYHDIAVDTSGNVYVGDILGNSIQKFSPTR